MEGWIKKHRSIMDHWIYKKTKKESFSRYEAWDYLLMKVNFKNEKVLIDDVLIDVPRGSILTSKLKLRELWNWSNTKVTNFLDKLKQEQMLDYKSTTKYTLISIVNYDKYQGIEVKETHQKHNENTSEEYQKHNENASETHQKNNENTSETHQKHTNKKLKNLRIKRYVVNNMPNVEEIKPLETSTEDSDFRDKELAEVQKYFESKIGLLSTTAFLELREFLSQGISTEAIKMAIDKAIDNGKYNWNYVKGVLNSWVTQNIKTKDQVLINDAKYRESKVKCGNVYELKKNDKPKSKFANYDQPDRDYEELERLAQERLLKNLNSQ